MRRVFDLLGAVLLGIATAPLHLAIAILVLARDGRPIYFRQMRVGQSERAFELWKFRTMENGADARGSAIVLANDARVTRYGAFLRRYRLDELPQLLMIVRGEMSFVGPRPEVPRLFARYPREVQEQLASVRPGLTDCATLASADSRIETAFGRDLEQAYLDIVLPEKARLAIACLQDRSALHYLRDVVRTLGWIVRRHSEPPNAVCR